MSYGYILDQRAQQEYEEAILWYLDRSLQATENFISAMEETLTLICDHPTRWRNEYKDFYEVGLKKYPYTIIYTVDPDQEIVFVTTVHHHKKSPRKKYRK
jgi:plasmid stabilization system protein ParE